MNNPTAEAIGQLANPGETAWLIESKMQGNSMWWNGVPLGRGQSFTTDPNSAIRFARKVDAERVSRNLHMTFVSEHVWINASRAEQAGGDEYSDRLQAAADKNPYVADTEAQHPQRPDGGGWKFVPADATQAMLTAWFGATRIHNDENDDRVTFAHAYRSMLAAAPAPPAVGEGDLGDVCPPMNRNEFHTNGGWKLHDCPDGHACRASIGGGCASGYCAHYEVAPSEEVTPDGELISRFPGKNPIAANTAPPSREVGDRIDRGATPMTGEPSSWDAVDEALWHWYGHKLSFSQGERRRFFDAIQVYLSAAPQPEQPARDGVEELPGMWERADLTGGATDFEQPIQVSTLPVDIFGKLYDVPIAVQLHIVNLREKVESLSAAPRQVVDEADRRAGAAERKLADAQAASRKHDEWLYQAKLAAGYGPHTLFSTVWSETLALAKKYKVADVAEIDLRDQLDGCYEDWKKICNLFEQHHLDPEELVERIRALQQKTPA